MSTPVFYQPRRPPPLYRLARALRRASIIVLLLLILFTVSVVYSTAQLTKSASKVSSFSAAFASNGTVVLSGSLTLNNPGFYPIQGLSIHVRVVNASGIFLGAFGFGPVTLPSQGSTQYPVTLYLPVSPSSPGTSLLIRTQYINVSVWGNATFGYLFPATVTFQENRSWGAPFDNLAITVSTPTLTNGTVVVPVKVSFDNEASFTEAGVIDLSAVATNGTVCGTASFTLNVDPNQQFSQSQPVTLRAGCSPAGGNLDVQYVTPSATISLPSEPIP
jgi:hypothetical protein